MTETTDPQEVDGSISFVRWLHAQKNSDPGRMMPYAAIYRWGKNIQAIVGPDGKYNAEWVALELSQQGADAEDLAALASAEAAWRVDSLIESAEIAGVSIDVGAEEIVPTAISTEIESAEAVVLCGYRNHRGEGCTSHAVEGAGRCGRHGGAITDPEVRRSFLLVAFAKVIDGSRVAVDALLDVAENGRSEMARVQAAKELLDRAGVSQDTHVHIHRPDDDASEDDLVDELRRRLSIATDRLRITAIPVSSEDTTDQLALPAYGGQFSIGVDEREPSLVAKENDIDDVVDAEIVNDHV